MRIKFFQDEDGSVPMHDWLDALSLELRARHVVILEGKQIEGNEMRRPQDDDLADGIRELRAVRGRVNMRILYFYGGADLAIMSHAIRKEGNVPAKQITKAKRNREKYSQDPGNYSVPMDLSPWKP